MPHHLASNGCRYYFETEGSGPPLVLLHGAIQSIGEWRRAGWTDRLRDRRTLVLVDLLGHGRSDRAYDRPAYAIESQAAAVLAIADRLGYDAFEVMGFSLGGRVSYELAARHPRRLRAMTIIAQHARAPATEPRLRDLVRAFRGGKLAAMERGLGIRSEPAAATVNDPEAMALTIEALREWRGAESELSRIPLPALVIAGELDPAVSAAASSAIAIPGAAFVELPGLDHSGAFYGVDAAHPHVASFLDRLDRARPETA